MRGVHGAAKSIKISVNISHIHLLKDILKVILKRRSRIKWLNFLSNMIFVYFKKNTHTVIYVSVTGMLEIFMLALGCIPNTVVSTLAPPDKRRVRITAHCECDAMTKSIFIIQNMCFSARFAIVHAFLAY